MFKFTVTQNSPEILAMEMNGELNTVAAQDLQEEIESLQKDMVKPMLIDVTRLNYISSCKHGMTSPPLCGSSKPYFPSVIVTVT